MSATNDAGVKRYALPGVPTPLLDADIANKGYVDDTSDIFAKIIKIADETIQTDIVLSQDSELFRTLPIGDYLVMFYLFINSDGTADFQSTVDNSTGTMTGDFSVSAWSGAAGTTQALGVARNAATGGTIQTIMIMCRVNVTVEGIIGLDWAQQTSQAVNTSVLQGSTMIIYQM